MQLFQKKYPLDSFLFLYPWSLKSLAVSDCFHSANTLPLAKRMLFTMSMMLGIGYPRCGGRRTRWQRCADRGDGNGRSWRGNPMRRGCWRCEMKPVNGTPWKSASMGRTLPIVLILIGYGENDLRKSRAVMAQTN